MIKLCHLFTLCYQIKKKVYKEFLQVIKQAIGGKEPKYILIDYEKAVINSIDKVFPHAHIQGCYFHFSQCVVRHIGACGLKKDYENDENFSHAIKMLLALAFVLPKHVIYV